MPTDITWTNTTVKLGDLQPWQRNPRKSSKKQAQRMLESFDKFGQVLQIAVGPGLEVYDGHQRLSALLTVHGKGYTVDARQASRELTEQEREQLVITLHTGATGAWDWDSLANWDATSLLEYGLDADALQQLNTDAASLGMLLESEVDWESGFDGLPTEDRAPFQQMTFTLHDTQAEQVKAAIAAAGKLGDFTDSPNENSNGNALAFICETFNTEHGQS